MIDQAPGAGPGHDELAPLLPFYELGELPAAQRRAFEAHALQCDVCFAELERAAPVAAALHGAREGALRILRGPQRRPRAAWVPWLGGGLVGTVATAAVAVALLRPPASDPPMGDHGTDGEVNSQPPAMIVPWVTPGIVRGSANSIVIPAGTRALVLAIAVPPGLDRSRAGTIEITAPSGAPIARIQASPTELQRSSLLALLQLAEPIQSGTYRVAFWSGEPIPAQRAISESAFEVGVAGERPPP